MAAAVDLVTETASTLDKIADSGAVVGFGLSAPLSGLLAARHTGKYLSLMRRQMALREVRTDSSDLSHGRVNETRIVEQLTDNLLGVVDDTLDRVKKFERVNAAPLAATVVAASGAVATPVTSTIVMAAGAGITRTIRWGDKHYQWKSCLARTEKLERKAMKKDSNVVVDMMQIGSDRSKAGTRIRLNFGHGSIQGNTFS
ncbi:MAG: hypothetical protein ACI9S8_002610 [Chlamydiales bacterium]